jgi:hypothetical protein
MSDFDRRLAQLLDDAVPQPPRALDPGVIQAGQLSDGRTSRPARTMLAVAAAVLVVAGIVTAVVVTRVPSRAPLAGGPQTSAGPTPAGPTLGGPDTATSRREITVHAVERLLATAPVPPNAIPSAHAPVAALRRPPFTPGETNLVRRTKWATAPETVDAALEYFAARLPKGFTPAMSSHSGGGGARRVYSRSFDVDSTWRNPAVYTGLEITMTAVRMSTGVGVRIDADAAWLTPRKPGSYLPQKLTGTRIVIRRDGLAPTVRRTLTVAEAAVLAHLINQLNVPTSGGFSCPAILPGHQDDRLIFATSGGTFRVDVAADGCRAVTVHGPRATQTLFGYVHGKSVDTAVLGVVGLPRNYGSR